MSSDLTRFGLAEMLRCRRVLRQAIAGAGSLEHASQRVCQALYDELRTGDGEKATVLVRCYKTHAFGKLDPELRAVARRSLGDGPVRDAMKFLVLLGTVGKRSTWCDRRRSKNHQAIPLASKDMIDRAPMISRLLSQLGVPIEHVLDASPESVREIAGRTYSVFHVEDAPGSPFIPAQEEFVLKYGVQSVVGFGGGLGNGDIFAIVLFSVVPISAESADRFRALALDAKAGFFQFPESNVFATHGK